MVMGLGYVFFDIINNNVFFVVVIIIENVIMVYIYIGFVGENGDVFVGFVESESIVGVWMIDGSIVLDEVIVM